MTTKLVQAEDEIQGWFAGRIPDGWFTAPLEITADREEILVVGTIAEPEYQKGSSAAAKSAAKSARISRFREETRDKRIGVALEAQHLFRARCPGARNAGTYGGCSRR